MKNFTKLTIGTTRHNIFLTFLNLHAQLSCKYHKYLSKIQISKADWILVFFNNK